MAGALWEPLFLADVLRNGTFTSSGWLVRDPPAHLVLDEMDASVRLREARALKRRAEHRSLGAFHLLEMRCAAIHLEPRRLVV